MKNKCLLPLAASLALALAALSGCGREPTGLGEALQMTMVPVDGYWGGTTSQGQSMSMIVAGDGTSVSSFIIDFRANETWGWADIQATYTAAMAVNASHQFSSGITFFDIRGTFTGNNRADGSFHAEGQINIGGTYYPFSESVTWGAALVRVSGKSPATAAAGGAWVVKASSLDRGR